MIKSDIIQELRELESTLFNVPAGNIYQVPDGYFEGFAALVSNRLKALNSAGSSEELNYLSPLLNTISKQLPYSVPEGYFNELPEFLMAGIRSNVDYQTADEELSSLSPLLNSLSKQNPYSIPDGYFEDFGKDINLKSDNRPATKTISMIDRRWFRFAAAALVIGLIAITGVSLFFNKKVPVSNTHEWVEKNMKKVSTDDINTFIQSADEENGQKEAIAISGKTEIKELLKDVSDKDIQTFLNETSSTDDTSDDLLLN